MRKARLVVLSFLLVFFGIINISSATEETTTEIQDKVFQIYAGVWNQIPDAQGLDYWTSKIQSGHFTYVDVATSFFDQPLVRAKYGGAQGDALLKALYLNLFKIEIPDAAGFAYWQGEVAKDSTLLTNKLGVLIMQMIDGMWANPAAAETQLLYTKFITAGQHFYHSQVAKGLIFSERSTHEQEEFLTAARNLTAGLTSETTEIEMDALIDVAMNFIQCGSGSCSGNPGSDEEPENRLNPFASEQALEDYIKSGLRVNADNQALYYYAENRLLDVATAPLEQYSSPSNNYSTTNIQEVGVDEADIVKSDGEYLYIAANLQQYSYYPVDSLVMDVAAPADNSTKSSIRIMALDDQDPEAREVASIPLSNFQNQVDGLYLVKGQDNNQSDLLVTIGGTKKDLWDIWSCSWCWQNSLTEVGIFDVSNPEDPQAKGHISLDGQLIASRRINDYLYLVTRYTPVLQDYYFYPGTTMEREKNLELLDQTDLKDLLPTIQVNGAEALSLVTPEKTYLPPLNIDRPEEPTLISVTAINLRDPDNITTETIAGPAETIYVSPSSIYVATTRYRYQPFFDVTDDAVTETDEVPPESTDIHKFSLDNSNVVYRGSGTVVGNLGWDSNKKPFRMGEHEGVLRVATSLGKTWNETSTTRLTLVQEGETGALEETAHIDNIGEPGERLYAVRYTGNRAYLVTFRVTDPLYVFDLSDPQAPVKEGELHIEGYSDYLYPISDTHLLGIGKDATPDGGSTDFGGRGAWYQGIKLSLINVEDISKPLEIDSVIIGKRGTESDALIDHHAVSFLRSSNNSVRMALPIENHDTPYDNEWFNPDNPSTHYNWTHTGLYMFEINEDLIESAGNLIVEDRYSGDAASYINRGKDRSVMVNDSIHYIHDGSVWSAQWGEPKTMTLAQ